MWARVVEISLGFWLMMSPFVFRIVATDSAGLINDLLCGLLAITFGFLSFWKGIGWAHFLTLAVSAWLLVSGFWTGHPAPPEVQNRIVVGLLLAMFAIIPNDIDEMPEEWQRLYANKNSTTE